MKPDFALLLSFDGIALLRRAEGGATGDWYRVGDVSPDTSNLPKALDDLRNSATDMGGDPAEVKLVLPTEQVRFLDIAAPAAGVSMAEAVESALDGATPYAIDDLVYDFEVRGGRLRIAAVARETLEEAESFATNHGFHPLSFVSDVSGGAGFAREPFFGPTETALTSLAPGVSVQGDDAPIHVVARPAPTPVSKPAPAPKPAASQPPVAPSTATAETGAASASDAKTAPVTKPDPKAAAKPASEPAPVLKSEPAAKPAPSAGTAPAAPDEAKPAPASEPDAKAVAIPAAERTPAAIAKPAPEEASKPEPAAKPDASAAPKPAPAAKPDAKATPKPASAAKPDANTAPKPAPAAKPDAKATAKPTPVAKPDANTAPKPAPAAKPDAKATAKPAPAAKPDANTAPKPAPSAKPDAKATSKPAPAAKPDANAAPKPAPAAKPDAKATSKPAPAAKAPKPAPVAEPAPTAAAQPTPAATPAPKPKAAAKPAANNAVSAPPPGPATPPVVAPAPDPEAAPSFASIRAHRDAPAPRPATHLSARADDMPGRRETPPGPPPKPRDTADDLAAKARASFSMRPKARPEEPDTAGSASALAVAASEAAPKAGAKSPIGFASRRKARKPDASPDVRKPAFGSGKSAAADSAVLDESERMTVFGARGQQKIGGKPRFLGLILTAALLLVMLAVAAMASIFLDEGLAGFFRRSPETQVAAVAVPEAAAASQAAEAEETPAPEVIEPVPETALALPDSGSIDPQDPAAINVAALNAGLPALTRDLAEDQVNGLSVPFEAEALTPEQAEARYAATGIWQRAPLPPDEPGQSLVGDVYVASIDPSVAVGDAVAIPTSREAQTDVVPGGQLNPYPADAGLTFDENGLIRPTPEGVRHPAGFLLIQGPPPIKPPLRPTPGAESSETTEAEEDDASAPQEAPELNVANAVDATLSGLKPRPRPGDLEEQNERANLGGVSLAELRQKRPRNRPEQVAEVAEATETVEEKEEIAASALAVAASPQPQHRPANIAALVTRAQRTPEPETARQTAAVAPRTVQPSIPSRSSVAAAATQKDAINLRKVNLIGVYGKPSSRRALVRLANGRYQKVKVGDRIDGGRVSAISESQLSYVKSGRNIVLRMPRG
ncbi:hypothetical protein [Marinovum sp.]|uniref:hypothetical protein n=1 Tax=Marinovum sp. TaxID=2024839 RepID=UPI002B274844|nr:hypothetical protein [Marinovum sp.]